MTPERPRSLADAVRALDHDALARLLLLRPDLAHPEPTSLTDLAERAGSAPSTRAATDRLDAWQRRVCVALAAVPDGVSVRTLAALVQAGVPETSRAVRELADRALAWEGVDGWRVTAGARQALGAWPAGLAPVSATPLTDTQIDTALAHAGPEVRALLNRLVWELPIGQVRDAGHRGSGDTPADRAIAAHLLRPWDTDTAILPREVSLRLRGGRLFEHPVPAEVPAWPPVDESRIARVSQGGEGNAYELVRLVEQTVDVVTGSGWRPLATGGVAHRDAATLARLVGREPQSRFVLNLAHQADLFTASGREWLATTAFDQWADADDLTRWRALVAAWRQMSDAPGEAGSGSRTTEWAAALRRLCLDEVLSAPPGTPIDADRLVARVSWRRPSTETVDLTERVDAILDEITLLGFVAMRHRTGVMVDPGPSFPERTDRLVVQADLTVVAAGPLTRDVAAPLALLADRESLGGGGVHRFTPDSIRRALDAGWTPDDIGTWLAAHSATGVPQPLDYLIGDVAARHGRIQVSAVAATVTVDDPAVLEALLHDPRLEELGLRRVGADVLGAEADAAEVVQLLRHVGQAPIARNAAGEPALTPAGRRARSAPKPPTPQADPASAARLADQLLARQDPVAMARSTDRIVDLLTRSAGSRAWLEIDRVLDDGTPHTATARVMAVSGGVARLQQKAAPMIVVAVSRIVGARVLGAREAHQG